MSYERWENQTAIIFAFVCGFLFVVGLCVHLSALFGFNFANQFPNVWFFLQTSIIAGFLPWLIGNPLKKIPKPPYVWGSSKYQESSKFGTYFGLIAAILFILSLVYLFAGEIYWSLQLHFGYLKIKDGNYFIYLKRERELLSITFDEYQKLSLYQNLFYSGHWMFFHLLGILMNLPEDFDLKKTKNE